MPRRVRRHRVARLKTAKYSNETFGFAGVLESTTFGVHSIANSPVVPTLQNGSFLGTRKAKNFTIRVYADNTIQTNSQNQERTSSSCVLWALVYVPEGTVPSVPNLGSPNAPSSIYDPNQNVICSGISTSLGGTTTVKTRLARNLNSNDQLYIVLYDLQSPNQAGDVVKTQTPIVVTINFAIAF